MKLITIVLCIALANYANSGLLEMSQELWSRVLNGGFRRLGKLDPLRIPVIKVDQSEGDTSYRVLLRNLEVTGLNNSKIDSVHIAHGKLNANLSDNEAGYVSYNEASDIDSIRYRFHTLIKEPKSNSEDRDLSDNERFDQFMLYDPAEVKVANEDDPAKAGTQDEQSRRYYNNNGPSSNVRRGYSQQQGEDTVFQLYHQPNDGNIRVMMNPTSKTPSQFRVVYTHNTQGNLPRPCIGACKPSYASNVRSGVKNYPSQPQQYPYGGQTRYHQGRVEYNEQTSTPAYEINTQFRTEQPYFGVKGGQKGGIQYSANFGGSSQSSEQRPNQFSIKGGNSELSYNGNYKTGPFAVHTQREQNYETTAQPQPHNQFSVKESSGSGLSYSLDYKKGPLSIQSQSGEGYGTTGYPENQYFGYSTTGYTRNHNFESNAPSPNQFEVNKGSGAGVNYAFDYGKDSVVTPSHSDDGYTATRRPEGQYYSSKGISTTNQPQNQFSIKGGSSGIDYSGRHKDGPLSIHVQSGNDYGSTGQPQDQYSVKGNNQGVKYVGHYPSNSGSGPYGQHQNPFFVKDKNQYGIQNGANYRPVSSSHDVKAQLGGAKLSTDYFAVNYSGNSGNYNNGEFSLQSGNQRDQMINRAYQTTRYTEATTPQYFEEFEPYKSPLIRLEKQPSYVDIVYASPGKPETQLRSRKLQVDSESDPRRVVFEEYKSSEGYATYNYTTGKPLNYGNDATQFATDTHRIKDLLRYAKAYQEEQGYYEEGMELVYHFGNLSNDSKINETLSRTKRHHKNDNGEQDDLMHVVVRLRIPQLGVKSNYALMGKVGRRQLRGGGILSGNFTDVTADFSVELKRMDNKTIIVRAARAKLVSKERKLQLQDMDENGPISSILSHGLMAAEAVAAMIADDLATKALNEDNNAETMIYKMYKNLPVLEKS